MFRDSFSVRLLLYVITAILIGWFSFEHRLMSNERSDNKDRCPYYISLQSILTNTQGLKSDRANKTFIKSKMAKFESDVQRKSKTNIAASSYKSQYYTILQNHHVDHIAKIKNHSKLMVIANETQSVIDNFYLDKNLHCINPLYGWDSAASRRILKYNLGSLFYNLPIHNSRILTAYSGDDQLGVHSGFLVNNQTTSLGPQFMTGIPLLTALYLMPGYQFKSLGTYEGIVPWGYFTPSIIADPFKRKILDIGGIDVFSFIDFDMRAKNVNQVSHATPLQNYMNTNLYNGFVLFKNDGSFGLAYIAKKVSYVNSMSVNSYEDMIKNYFATPTNHDENQFKLATDYFYDQLIKLPYQSAILEDQSNPGQSLPFDMQGVANVKGIVGNRVIVETDCRSKKCILVLNVTKAPGWHVFVNQQETKMFRANFAFMSAEVPEGKSVVWFVYERFATLMSYFISLITLLTIFVFSKQKIKV